MVQVGSSPSEIKRVFPKISDIEITYNKQLFAKFDKDNDGYLNQAEFKAFLKDLGDEYPDADLNSLLKELASNANKGISFEDFIRNLLAKDAKAKYAAQKTLQYLSVMSKGASISVQFENTVDKFPDKTAIIFEDQYFSYRHMDNVANQTAHWFQSIGLKKGDLIALDMDNRPEFITTWMGMAKLGGASALINHNLKGKSLVHCVSISGAKVFVFGIEVAALVAETADELTKLGFKLYCHGGDVPFAERIDTKIAKAPTHRLPVPQVLPTDLWALIYTSGTTGLPKAAVQRHMRFWGTGAGFASAAEMTENDILYNVLPLYHSAGGTISAGIAFTVGATMVIRRKFSASAFWDEIRKYNCTFFQYIGELCRYLMNAPPSPKDKQHKIRRILGNGLRPDIWGEFQNRFGIPEVTEFYAATEGNVAFMHTVSGEEGRGAVGFTGKLQRKSTGNIKIVKFDVVNEVPIRGSDGFCILCTPNEGGELLGEITAGSEFVGYYGNPDGTKKKILTDVFKKGDAFFRTGDLLKADEKGYYYFIDRIGDTFRWKGENVSTNEVAEILSLFPGIQEANVYGVQIPGQDGRAGMAAVVLKKGMIMDFYEKLGLYVSDKLPQYSIPYFIRILPEISITGTFKHQKVELRNEGMDPTKIKDPIYFYDSSKKAYRRFLPADHANLIAGKSKL